MNEDNDFNKWYLHDAELKYINYDYQKNELIVETSALEKPNTQRKPFTFKFVDVKRIAVDATKPWGEGIYIFEQYTITDKDLNKELNHYCFRTNAGDTFDVFAKNVLKI